MLTNWRFKHCVRCGGDTYLEQERRWLVRKCLQCGYSKPEYRIKNSKTEELVEVY